jgi:hypothetical protein
MSEEFGTTQYVLGHTSVKSQDCRSPVDSYIELYCADGSGRDSTTRSYCSGIHLTV